MISVQDVLRKKVELSLPIRVSRDQFLEDLKSGDPIRTWSYKVDGGGPMRRTLVYDDFRNGIKRGVIYDYIARGYQVMKSIEDGGDTYRTIVLDSVWKYIYKNKLYVIQ